MKTAISTPDPISEYLEKHKYEGVTESLNQVYAGVLSGLDEELTVMQFNSIEKDAW